MNKYTVFMLIYLFIFTGIAQGITYQEDCETDDDFQQYFNKKAYNANVENYTIQVGFGTNEEFIPTEISILFKDDSCTDIVSYHSHNGDLANFDDNLIEHNFTFSEDLFSSIHLRIVTRNEGIDRAGWEVYGNIFITSSSYTITVDDTVESEDPFNGSSQNNEIYIIATIDIGSSTELCTFFKYNDGTNDYATFRGVNGDACTITVAASDGSSYTSYMNIVDQVVTIDTDTKLFSPKLETLLYYNENGNLLETDATLQFDGMSFYFNYYQYNLKTVSVTHLF